jgi:hypothetical protein
VVNRRDLHADTLAALQGPFYPVVLLYVDWPGDVVRVHSGLGVISWAGHDWQGVGAIDGAITLPGEESGLASFEGILTLGGLPTEIDDYLRAASEGRDVDIWFGVVTERAGNVLVGEPFPAFLGAVSGVEDEQSVGARGISVGITPGPSQRAQGSGVHSDADQKAQFVGDTAGRWTKAAFARTGAELPKW